MKQTKKTTIKRMKVTLDKKNAQGWNWKKNKVKKNIKSKTNSNKKNENQNWLKLKLEDTIDFWKIWQT
jgi:hypothetical protein